jgi:hypothetical protein
MRVDLPAMNAASGSFGTASADTAVSPHGMPDSGSGLSRSTPLVGQYSPTNSPASFHVPSSDASSIFPASANADASFLVRVMRALPGGLLPEPMLVPPKSVSTASTGCAVVQSGMLR